MTGTQPGEPTAFERFWWRGSRRHQPVSRWEWAIPLLWAVVVVVEVRRAIVRDDAIAIVIAVAATVMGIAFGAAVYLRWRRLGPARS